MATSNNIQYLRNHEIDRNLWDTCINNADNGLIYAHSFFLDSMCDNWDAFVYDNYRIVMPLPWRSKWGLKYVYQPPFIQRLGIFGNAMDEQLTNQLFKEATKYFQFIHYNISSAVNLKSAFISQHNNFIIDLNQEYLLIKKAYTKECNKNLLKAQNRGCIISNQFEIEEVIALYQAAYGNLNHHLNSNSYRKLSALIKNAIHAGQGEIVGIKDKNGETLFGGAVFKDTKRIYYILGAPTIKGRETRSTYFFIDSMLEKNANTPLHFDFEGSDLPNVAAFYKRFGPKTEHYYELKINTLPKIIKWLKP